MSLALLLLVGYLILSVRRAGLISSIQGLRRPSRQ
jgi:hypothetical protein